MLLRFIAASAIVGTIFVLSPVSPFNGPAPLSAATLAEQARAELMTSVALRPGFVQDIAQEMVRKEWAARGTPSAGATRASPPPGR